MMKVVLVGGNSSVALALKPVLSSFCEVITAGRSGCDIHLDLNDSIDKMILPEQVDVVVHLAAHFGGKDAKAIEEAEKVNVLGTQKLCEVAAKSKVKHFIFISSIFATLKPDAPNYSVYAYSKKQAEEVATQYCSEHQLPLTILRPSQIYGIGESFKKHQPFFYTILEQAKNGQDINLYGNHDPKRNYIFMDDLTAIIATVIQQKVTGVFSCTQLTDITYSEIARAAFSAYHTKGNIHFMNDKPNIPDVIFDKDDTLYQKIGFYPQINIEAGIKKIAQNQNHTL